MIKKAFLLTSVLLVPSVLGACDVFKSDKDVVLDAVQHFEDMPSKSLESKFSISHDKDWSLSFLNNTNLTAEENVKGDDYDLHLHATSKSNNESYVISLAQRNNELLLDSKPLIAQFEDSFVVKKDAVFIKQDNLYVNDFKSEDYQKLLAVLHLPVDDLLKSKEEISKSTFSEMKDTESSDAASHYMLRLSEKDINAHFPSLAKQKVKEIDYHFGIDNSVLKSFSASVVIDLTGDGKYENIELSTTVKDESNKLVPVKNKVTLKEFLDGFDVTDEQLKTKEIIPEDEKKDTK